MEYADKSGLLTYEEPGGYRVAPNPEDNIEGPDEQALALRKIKLERMVIRDRSLPSMVIYNLKNEATNPPDDHDYANVKMVHELDPSRIVTYNSDRNRDILTTRVGARIRTNCTCFLLMKPCISVAGLISITGSVIPVMSIKTIIIPGII